MLLNPASVGSLSCLPVLLPVSSTSWSTVGTPHVLAPQGVGQHLEVLLAEHNGPGSCSVNQRTVAGWGGQPRTVTVE